MSVPTLTQSASAMRQHWDDSKYPRLVYVETTNACDARCSFCLYERMERPVVTMGLVAFKEMADKVKAGGLKIGAVFCFGEPLLDKQIFNKIRYARLIEVATPYLGLNTNCSQLTPDRFDDILETCSNITLSFVNVGREFEHLTGLDWDVCYGNAIKFIQYRDEHRPGFQVEIGCNDVTGHDRVAVQAAFAGCRVAWARDAQIQWGGKTITGVIDRSIMYHKWVCDGYKGAMQIKPNGDCCFCAYDVIRNETKFANIFEDDWETIERNFKALWRQPSSLCLRCDFWWNYNQMIVGGWRRGDHIDNSWQDAYGDKMIDYWQEQHNTQNRRFLTGTTLNRVMSLHNLSEQLSEPRWILNIGVGEGHCSKALQQAGHIVAALDVSAVALVNVAKFTVALYDDPVGLPDSEYDVAICHLVVQHMTDVDVIVMIRNALRSLKQGGILSVQYASPPEGKDHVYSESLQDQKLGIVQRTREHFHRLVEVSGGVIEMEMPTKTFDPSKATDDGCWNVAHLRKGAA